MTTTLLLNYMDISTTRDQLSQNGASQRCTTMEQLSQNGASQSVFYSIWMNFSWNTNDSKIIMFDG